MQFVMQFAQGLGQAWTRLSTSARVNLAIASLVTVLLIVAMVLIETRPHYVPLFPPGLEAADATKIQSYLADQGIPFQIKDNGQTILVPQDRRSGAILDLGQQGLPTQLGTGFEIFDQQNLLTTESQRSIQYQRALGGELMRQLNQLSFVNRSNAYISIPQEALFESEQQPAQAAVTLDLNRKITPGETKALLHLIGAYGGGNLTPNNITIMASDGTPLHVPSDDDVAGLASSKQEVIENWERQREAKLEGILKDMGAKVATVAISAHVDFTSERKTVNTVSDGVVVESTTTSRTVKNEPAAEGAPGAASNPPEGVVQGGTVQSSETTEETTETMQPSTSMTETITDPGSNYKFSVSATVDMGNYRKATDASGQESGEEEYVPLTPEQLQTFRTMLANATDPEMSPEDVQVFDMPLQINRLSEVKEAEQDVLREAAIPNWQEYATNTGKLVAVLLGILVVRRLLKRSMVPVEVLREEVSPIPTASPDELRKQKIAADVERMSQENPETVAALLRTWLSEAEE